MRVHSCDWLNKVLLIVDWLSQFDISSKKQPLALLSVCAKHVCPDHGELQHVARWPPKGKFVQNTLKSSIILRTNKPKLLKSIPCLVNVTNKQQVAMKKCYFMIHSEHIYFKSCCIVKPRISLQEVTSLYLTHHLLLHGMQNHDVLIFTLYQLIKLKMFFNLHCGASFCTVYYTHTLVSAQTSPCPTHSRP